MDPTPSLGDVLDRTVAAHRALADLGETIEDEWTFVNDLHAAWSARLAEIAAARGSEEVPPWVLAAVDEAIAETEMGLDPHRAIDWLSTLPQVVLLAVGEPA